MKLMWNKNKTHAVVRKQIREFIIVDNPDMNRTDLLVKTSNGANVFLESFTNATEAQDFIVMAIKDIDTNTPDNVLANAYTGAVGAIGAVADDTEELDDLETTP